jgi:hypothetical protein
MQREKAARPFAPRSADDRGTIPSALRHWPVQIRLVPPTAPFLNNADLLVAADCAPVACGAFHRDFIPGKAVMLGCPKFDDTGEYVKKFAEIFRVAGIRSITVVDMDVPCCSGLPMIVRRAFSLAKKGIPMEEVVIGRRGDVLRRRSVASGGSPSTKGHRMNGPTGPMGRAAPNPWRNARLIAGTTNKNEPRAF